MQRVFGIETEYGITIDGIEDLDVVAESIAIVRSYTNSDGNTNPEAALKWDYQGEDPHQDARGFRANGLLEGNDEPDYSEQDRSRNLSFQEIKSDLVLSNGARFYNDHAHPEYSTPECLRLVDLVAQDKAGERILEECARRRNRELTTGRVKIYKNNTDFNGHSYGCHDNYLMKRSVPFERIVEGMIPFLVTRQIYTGTGKVGIEGDAGNKPGHYQISQRSDFFSVLVSIDTMSRRPIINTRDEPHADPKKWRRLHVIIGDANMNEFATALKIGTTALAIGLIENDSFPREFQLADPVAAIRSISHDQSYQWLVKLKDGRNVSALDIQRAYHAQARKEWFGRDPETDWLINQWEIILNDLEQDPMQCADRLDWVSKKYLLDLFAESENVSWEDPWLQSLDLEYHNVDRSESLYYELVRSNKVRRVVTDYEIGRSIYYPPLNTRAYFRGRCVDRFAREIGSVQWDEVVFHTNGNGDAPQETAISLRDVFDEATVEKYNKAVDTAQSAEEVLTALGIQKPEEKPQETTT
ncbi:MAG: proteasome accessory factor PafA2 [Verrucomicrobiae bacterium]|nr:proteasome accessory factor PafA2 [Verrucomicrobiae bacterium]